MHHQVGSMLLAPGMRALSQLRTGLALKTVTAEERKRSRSSSISMGQTPIRRSAEPSEPEGTRSLSSGQVRDARCEGADRVPWAVRDAPIGSEGRPGVRV